jgi:hypothetical protein
MLNFIAFIAITLACIVGLPLVVLACALWLPLGLLWTLVSPIWQGEIRVPVSPEGKAGSDDEADSDDGLSDTPPEADDKGEPTAADRRRIQLGALSHSDRDVAIRSYYYGPAIDDLLDSASAMWQISQAINRTFRGWAKNFAESGTPILNVVIPFCVNGGLPIGFALGIGAAATIGLAYTLVIAVSMAIALCLSLVFRWLDSAMCFIWGIARTCWTCGENILHCPFYICPRCETLHRNIRPGPYGVLRRSCVCGKRFSTMLLTGAAKLQGVCPNCDAYLPRMFGRAAEIVVPIFGATNVGKTRLMYMMVLALKEWVHDQHGKVIYIGDASERLDIIGDALRMSQHTEKTVPGPPRGLGLHIKFGLSNRLVYFFDAAGEMYTSHDNLPELKYLNKARAYVFVADPFGSKNLWSQLSPADQERLKRFRSPPGYVDRSFQATTNHMLKIAQRRRLLNKRSDLAFVVSKRDLLQSAGVVDGISINSMEGWVSERAGLNLGNISRGAGHSFEDVKYFCTAALEEEGHVDESIEDLMRWILDRSGVRMGT